MADPRPVTVIAALEQEAHALVRRMPRAESVGPRLSIWEGGGLVVMVAGVGKVAAALAAQYACDVFKPRCLIGIGLAGGLEDGARPGQVIVATGAGETLDLRGVIGFGVSTAANLFESIIQAVVDGL